jgi:HPr kinase/phosphorylase
MFVHATCILIDGQGVLLAGSSGSGKSDLALRLIDEGACLVSDDQTVLRLETAGVVAAAPVTIEGLFEIRHLGLVRMPFATEAPIALWVELAERDELLERLPDADFIVLFNQNVPRLRLWSFAASTPAKIRAFLTYPRVSA